MLVIGMIKIIIIIVITLYYTIYSFDNFINSLGFIIWKYIIKSYCWTFGSLLQWAVEYSV